MSGYVPLKPTVNAGTIVPAQQLSVGTGAIAFAKFNTQTNVVALQIRNNDVYCTVDGTTPSSSNAVVLFTGQNYHWDVQTAQRAAFVQAAGSSAVIYAQECVTALDKSVLPSMEVWKPRPEFFGTAPGTLTGIPSIAALRALSVVGLTTNIAVEVLGYYNPNDNGGGVFYYNSASSATDDGGAVVAPTVGSGRWIRIFDGSDSPEMWGAKGDGVSDDYTALTNLAAFVNAAGSGSIRFGQKRTYFLNKHITTSPAGFNLFSFSGCDGLTIEGNGSTILVQGGFARASVLYSTLPGIQIFSSSNVIIRNLYLNGNNTTVTNSGGYDPPGYGMGLGLYSVINALVENVTATNWITDGLYLDADTANPVGGKYVACKSVIFKNCHSYYNCRQGMSVIQLRHGIFDNCEFALTGQSSYGGAAPTAGVDIEPDFSTLSSPTPADVNTGHLLFSNCRAHHNGGMTISNSTYDKVDDTVFDACRLESIPNGRAGSTVGLQMGVPNCTVRDCYIDMQDRDFAVSGVTATLCTTVIKGNEIRGYGNLISDAPSMSAGCPVLTQGNRFYFTPPVSWTGVGATNVCFLQNTQHIWKDNFIFVSQNAYAAASANTGGWIGVGVFNSILYSGGNHWTTDLPNSAYMGNTAQFIVGYDQAITNKYPVLNDFFTGTAVGTADTFRPLANNTVYDSNYPFSAGQTAAGYGLALGEINDVRVYTGSSAPGSGTWKTGDIFYQNAPSSGGYIGSVCVAGGSPGTWKTFGLIS